jgi:hypothetical protein
VWPRTVALRRQEVAAARQVVQRAHAWVGRLQPGRAPPTRNPTQRRTEAAAGKEAGKEAAAAKATRRRRRRRRRWRRGAASCVIMRYLPSTWISCASGPSRGLVQREGEHNESPARGLLYACVAAWLPHGGVLLLLRRRRWRRRRRWCCGRRTAAVGGSRPRGGGGGGGWLGRGGCTGGG